MTRVERVENLLKSEISQILKRKVNDPRIGFVSITAIEMSTDLHHAKIFVSVFGSEEEKQQTFDGLESAKSFIRGELGNGLAFRVVPELHFVRDDSIERGMRLTKLINEISRKDQRAKNAKPKAGRRRTAK